MTDVPARQPAISLPTTELDFELPEHLIATQPADPRDSARMLVLHRQSDRLEHRHVRDLPAYVNRGDALVFNTTAVTPARLVGERRDTRGRVEGLYLATEPQGLWQVMLKSNGRLRSGQRIELHDAAGARSGHALELIERKEELWLARLDDAGADEAAVLDVVGRTPLPPYILRARGEHAIADALDRSWYQTVYASGLASDRRSVAAPTAGLHFTPQLLERIDAAGGQRLNVLLHVGAGTFKPVTAPTLAEHDMHSEQYEVPPATLAGLRSIDRARGERVIAIGTTTVRTLESLPMPLPAQDEPVCGHTRLLIAPPYAFRHVDAMLTNFHLPRSTLLALVGAIVGLERLKAVYAEAIRERYRFFSYGDAMLILP